MKKLSAAAVALLLAGCASIPTPKAPEPQKINRAVKANRVAPVVQPDPVATTPNQVVKKRWYDRFLRHKTAK